MVIGAISITAPPLLRRCQYAAQVDGIAVIVGVVAGIAHGRKNAAALQRANVGRNVDDLTGVGVELQLARGGVVAGELDRDGSVARRFDPVQQAACHSRVAVQQVGHAVGVLRQRLELHGRLGTDTSTVRQNLQITNLEILQNLSEWHYLYKLATKEKDEEKKQQLNDELETFELKLFSQQKSLK